ncbi:MAG: carbohydrate binding domain-containing protein [Planctomycetota bacterium]
MIEEHVAATVAYAKATEDNDFDYKLRGVIFDVIEIWKEFNWNSTRGLPGTPDTERFGREAPGVTHDYATLREGWYVFLGHLRDKLENAFPDRPIYFILEPTPIVSEWVEPLNSAPYATLTPELREKIRGDALVEEKPGLQYLIDPAMDGPDGWPHRRRGSATSDLFSKGPHYPTHLVYFGEISSRGGYLFSYGSGIDRTRDPVYTFGNQFKLFRVLSAWQNQHGTPVDMRVWDAEQEIYSSPTAYADPHGLAGVHPKNGRLYAVLMDEDAAIHLAEGAALTRLRSANAYWEPELVPDAEFRDGVLRPTSNAPFPVSVIADLEVVTPNQAVLTAAPGVALQQDRTRVVIPNRELLNPDFEQGIEGWSGSGKAAATLVDEPVASGRQAARVHGRELPWNGLNQDVSGVLMNFRQGRYRVRARVRSDEGPGVFTVMLRVLEGDKKSEFVSQPIDAPAGEWVTLDEEIELDWEDFITRANLSIERRSDTDDFFVDDVRMEYLGKSAR